MEKRKSSVEIKHSTPSIIYYMYKFETFNNYLNTII